MLRRYDESQTWQANAQAIGATNCDGRESTRLAYVQCLRQLVVNHADRVRLDRRDIYDALVAYLIRHHDKWDTGDELEELQDDYVSVIRQTLPLRRL